MCSIKLSGSTEVEPTALSSRSRGMVAGDGRDSASVLILGACRGAELCSVSLSGPAEAEPTATRNEMIEQLPVFGDVTGLQPVTPGITITVLPMRCGSLAAAYFDEGASVSVIMGKVQTLTQGMEALIAKAHGGTTLADLSIGGRPEVSAMRCSEPFKNGRCGLYKDRCA